MADSSTSPLVSIIMPTYNRAGLIGEVIETICGQTYPHWELMIFDDGSVDNTEEIIKAVGDSRIQYYRLERTGMVSRIKNNGIQRARGEFIAFADSDDPWNLTKLEKQVAALREYPEAGFCLTGAYTFTQTGQPISYYYKGKTGTRYGDIFISLFKSEVASLTQTLLFRKECVSKAGFFDESKPFSDPDFIVALAGSYKAVVLFEPLLYRRLHDSNDSAEHWEQRNYEWIAVIKAYQQKKMLPSSVARDCLFKLHINFGEKNLRYRKSRKAIIQFMNAWKNKPQSIIPLKKMIKTAWYFLAGK